MFELPIDNAETGEEGKLNLLLGIKYLLAFVWGNIVANLTYRKLSLRTVFLRGSPLQENCTKYVCESLSSGSDPFIL